jgi:hypothetical protein
VSRGKRVRAVDLPAQAERARAGVEALGDVEQQDRDDGHSDYSRRRSPPAAVPQVCRSSDRQHAHPIDAAQRGDPEEGPLDQRVLVREHPPLHGAVEAGRPVREQRSPAGQFVQGSL